MMQLPSFLRLAGALLVIVALIPSGATAQEAPLGTTLPQLDRSLQTVDGSTVTLGGLRGSTATVIVFWSNQCPWVDKYEERVVALAARYRDQGVNFVMLNPNDPNAFPQESAQEGRARAQRGAYGQMPYVIDARSQLATALGASRTPHVFVFDSNNALVYVGGIDDSPGDPGNVSKQYLADALDAVGAGRAVSVSQTRAFGCTIKFHQ